MPVCPVCEHPQEQGDACDVCGRAFEGAGARPAPVAPVEGLEPTLHAAVPEPRDALAELEPTAAARAPEVAAAAVEGLELTTLTAGEPDPFDLPPEPLDGLEPTASEAAPEEATPRGPIVCRYCRTPASGWERLCLRCGMRLPLPRAAGGPKAPSDADRRPCSDCGTPSAGATCPACGARQGGR